MTETHDALHWGGMVLWILTILIALIGIVWLGIRETRKFRGIIKLARKKF